ncbi:MAG TPA: PAS domain S-box protein [Pyrinomonadaceae bacterium]|nr:PAS domain S-box protein [Pyrinomonadaceae bacterium]
MVDTDSSANNLLARLLDASVDGLLAFDRECRYTAWNSAMERLSGFRREDVLGRDAFELFPFLLKTGEDRFMREALEGRNAVAEARAYIVPETGHRGFFDGYYSPLRDERGQVVGGMAVIRDITASRAAGEALRESEERYRAFIANSSEAIWRCEMQPPVPTGIPVDEQVELYYRRGHLAECNDAMARMYGYERAEEITGARLSDLLVRDDPSNVEYLRSFVAAGYRLTEAESVEVDREGRTRFFSNNLVGVVKDGALVRAWGTQRDITARRRIEEELKATEHRFSMFMENLPGLAWMKDLEGRYVYANEAAARAFGLPREQLRGKTDEEIFPAETARRFRENDRQALASGEGLLTVEKLEQPDGVHHSIVSKFPVPGRDGEAVMVGGVAVDITERMRAEEALRESEERYRSLLENANDIIYSHDLAGNYLTINRACEVVTGYTREEMLGRMNIAQVVVPEHLELARGMTERKLHDSSPTVYEVDIHTKDRRRLTLEVSTRIAHREGRGPVVEGIARDVTERKRAEREREELLERERRARREAEEALGAARSVEESLGLLVEASGVLLGSLTLDEVQPAVLDISRRLVAADAYAVWRGDAVKKTWRIVSSAGLSEKYRAQVIENWEPGSFKLEAPVVAEDIESDALLGGRVSLYHTEGIRSLLAVPLRIRGETSGTLTYYYHRPHHFGERELRVATALANLAGAAIGGAELYDEQRRLRAEAEAAEWRSNFLSEASRVLSSSLDYSATLARVARLSVPELADWCAVDVVEEDHTVRRLAVAHVDPAKVEWAHEIQERYPPDMDAPRGVPQVLRTGVSEIYPDITDEMLAQAAKDEAHLRLLRSVGFSSAMLVPLTARGRTHGVVTFITAESGRRYTPQDLALAEDLARRAAVAVEHARLYESAQRANRLKDEFLATVSHELRTPLTAILGWAHMLRRDIGDETTRRHALEVIERNAYAQKQLIEDILEVSRVVTGKVRVEVRPVELVPVVEAAREAVQPAAEAKGIRMESAYDVEAASVSGDPDRLQQVVWNLLTNAVKFTPQGGRVSIRVARAGAAAEVSVSDTGEGIPPEFLPHVFERFRQADMGTTRRHGGLGLGLSIVRHLVEMHGGSVRAESGGAGRGSTFTVRLPLRGADEFAPPLEQTTQSAGHDAPTARPPGSLAGLRLLVVEDEPDTLDLLRMFLSGYGADVTTARSAAEALAALDLARPDVIVSDVGMSNVDGYELLRRVRALGPSRGGDVPAVALTAYAREEDRALALDAGFNEHVPKPVDPSALAKVIAALVGDT